MSARSTALWLLAFCIVAEVARELCFKVSAAHAAPVTRGFAARLARQPRVWVGVLLWAIGAFAWIGVLSGLPLGVAFPLMTLTYAAIPLAAMLLLGERLRKVQLAGAVLVMAGVGCIAWSEA